MWAERPQLLERCARGPKSLRSWISDRVTPNRFVNHTSTRPTGPPDRGQVTIPPPHAPHPIFGSESTTWANTTEPTHRKRSETTGQVKNQAQTFWQGPERLIRTSGQEIGGRPRLPSGPESLGQSSAKGLHEPAARAQQDVAE